MKVAFLKKLSPAAARLYLALLLSGRRASYDEIVSNAGIEAYQTMKKAKEQLAELGFIRIGEHGQVQLLPIDLPQRQEG